MTKIQHKDGQIEEAKLNAAYAGGGAELAISTIQKMMNIHIDRYIMVNMHGFAQLVDAVGGITVNNTLGFPILSVTKRNLIPFLLVLGNKL